MKRIGIIDSGIGGFTILKKLMDKNLEAEFYYISDEKNVPYGEKSQTFIYNQMCSMTEKLLKLNVHAVLIACNTATAETIDRLRLKYNVFFIGIEPYINYINKIDTTNKHINLILTQATYNSRRFKKLIKRLDPSKKIQIYPQKNLALLIERLKYEEFNIVKNKINEELAFLNTKKTTHLILGCTHYPIITDYIEKQFKIKTIDPTDFVINHVIKSLNINTKDIKNKLFNYNYNNSNQWKKHKLEDFNFIYN